MPACRWKWRSNEVAPPARLFRDADSGGRCRRLARGHGGPAVTQTLGGNVTVRTDQGLFRIAVEDTGALEGYEPAPAPAAQAGEAFSEEAVWGALKTCFDPEIPVNIVDLGLVYDLLIAKPRRAAMRSMSR